MPRRNSVMEATARGKYPRRLYPILKQLGACGRAFRYRGCKLAAAFQFASLEDLTWLMNAGRRLFGPPKNAADVNIPHEAGWLEGYRAALDAVRIPQTPQVNGPDRPDRPLTQDEKLAALRQPHIIYRARKLFHVR